MKALQPKNKILLTIVFLFLLVPSVNGQILKKLGKKASKAAERAVERRVEKEAEERTERAMDSILEPGKKGKSKKQKSPKNQDTSGNENQEPQTNPEVESGESPSNTSGEQKSLDVYRKFDFVPGDKQLFFDDFSNDFIGDFPAKWNTNGSGEIVTIGDDRKRWMEILPGNNVFYIPDVALPEEYTVEFDINAMGIDKKTSSVAVLKVRLSNDANFERHDKHFIVEIPFCQYIGQGFRVSNKFKDQSASEINNKIGADIRNVILEQPHISIAVNKQRFRLWVNERKYVDIPRGVPSGMTTLKFELNTFEEGKERAFIGNIKVAEGGVDLRRKLLAEGRISTNAILFDSGSANLQPQSMGVIRQISQVLQQDANINLQIVGHTDSDGNDDSNMNLSKKRATAVKDALVRIYNVAADRLSTDGKGESEPLADNGSTIGKAQNRRVEFIKL